MSAVIFAKELQTTSLFTYKNALLNSNSCIFQIKIFVMPEFFFINLVKQSRDADFSYRVFVRMAHPVVYVRQIYIIADDYRKSHNYWTSLYFLY